MRGLEPGLALTSLRARLPTNLSPTRLQIFQRGKNAPPATLIIKPYPQAWFFTTYFGLNCTSILPPEWRHEKKKTQRKRAGKNLALRLALLSLPLSMFYGISITVGVRNKPSTAVDFKIYQCLFLAYGYIVYCVN